jgi:hypothetical protein
MRLSPLRVHGDLFTPLVRLAMARASSHMSAASVWVHASQSSIAAWRMMRTVPSCVELRSSRAGWIAGKHWAAYRQRGTPLPPISPSPGRVMTFHRKVCVELLLVGFTGKAWGYSGPRGPPSPPFFR